MEFTKIIQVNFITSKFINLLLILLALIVTSCVPPKEPVLVYDPAINKIQNMLEFEKFNKKYKNKWNVIWDENTGTPHRISGYYIGYDQPTTKESIKKFSDKFIDDHNKLLQIDTSQLKLSKIDIEKREKSQPGNMYVCYSQYYKGIPVYGGNVRLIFHAKKLSVINSDYYPSISIKVQPELDKKQINAIAVTAVESKSVKAPEKTELIIYPIPLVKKIKYHLAYKVTMPVVNVQAKKVSTNPNIDNPDNLVPVKWMFFIDANTGVILSRINLVKNEDLTGKVTAMIYPATPADAQIEKPLEGMNITITQGAISLTTATNTTGDYQFTNLGAGNINLEAHLKGPYIRVYNTETGEPAATYTTTTTPGVLSWNWSTFDPSPSDVESNAFYHATLIRNYYHQGDPFNITPVSPEGPSKDYLNVRVRENYCNAYAYIGGGQITFGSFQSGGPCTDRALCADIIYHEYTHLVVQQIYDDAGVNIEGTIYGDAFHEGFSDYFGCSITGNPHHGGGCWSGRHIDSPDMKYPDNFSGDSHSDGIIISGALWDTGAALGATYTDNLAIRAIKHTPSSFSEYLGAVLEEDDNTAYSSDPTANDFPSDGTPNIDAICHEFYDVHGIFHSYCTGHTDSPIAILITPSAVKKDLNFYNNSVTTIQITGTALGSRTGPMKQYTIQYMSADAVGTWSSGNITLMNGGNSPVDNGVLGTWDISAVPDGFYLVKLVVTGYANETSTTQAQVYINRGIMSGWPQITTNYFPSAPIIADIDPAFPGKEIIAKERWGTLYAFHTDGSMAPGWPKTVPSWPAFLPPAVADMNGDGYPDVIVAGGTTLCCYSNNGTTLPGWPVTLDRDIKDFYSIAVADIDGDKKPEVVLAIQDGTVYLYDHDGTPVPGWPVSTNSTISTDVAVANIDPVTAGFEVVVCNDNGVLNVYSSSGTTIAGWPQTIPSQPQASPAVADIDGDNKLEIVIGTSSSAYAFNHDGSVVAGWPVNFGFNIDYGTRTSIVLADIDKDGFVEVIVKGYEKTGIWKHDGSSYAGSPFMFASVGGDSYHNNLSSIVGDINLDGNYELLDTRYFSIFGDPAIYGYIKLHRIYALNNSGAILANWPKYVYGLYTPGMPVISDIDNDGQLELAATCFGLFVWDLPGSGPGGHLVEWGDFRHDYSRTGLYGYIPPSPVYVNSSTGNDAYDGSSPTYLGSNVGPKKTIQAGINVIPIDGGVCSVAQGTYIEHIVLREGIVVKGSGASVTTINGGGSGPVVTGANNCTIDGFTITGVTSGGFPNASGILCEGASPTITNNIISNIAIYPIFVRNAHPLIQNNTIFGSGNNGIYNSIGSGAVIVNNVIYGCQDMGIYCLSVSPDLLIANNTIVNNAFGINVQSCPAAMKVANNIVANNATGIYVSGNSPSITHNDIWNNSTNYSGCGAGTGDISANPLFVNEGAHNYHLQAGSPCIDAGTDVGQPYSGSAPDIGSFEQ